MAATLSLNQVNIRLTHRLVYRLLSSFAIFGVLSAVNFWTANPTFNPLGINKSWIAVVYLLLGLWQLFWLNVRRSLDMVRLGTSAIVGWLVIWGGGNMEQVFDGKASWQLPLWCGLGAIWHWWILQEPVFNPISEQLIDLG